MASREDHLYTKNSYCYNKNTNITERLLKAGDNMTGKEVVNLIQKLEEEGMSAEKIIEIIKYIETAEPKAQ